MIIIFVIILLSLTSWKIIEHYGKQDNIFLNKELEMNFLENQNKEMDYNKFKLINNNVKLMRIYLYFCLNYDNFNLNVNEVKYTYGKSCFFPVYVMTGLKFVTHMEDPVDKLKRIIRGYNAYSILFLPYMDFGIFGIAIFMFIMGILCFFFESVYPDVMFSSILKFCLLFSFFNPYLIYPTTTIFYIVFLIVAKWVANKYFNGVYIK